MNQLFYHFPSSSKTISLNLLYALKDNIIVVLSRSIHACVRKLFQFHDLIITKVIYIPFVQIGLWS